MTSKKYLFLSHRFNGNVAAAAAGGSQNYCYVHNNLNHATLVPFTSSAQIP